MPLWALRTTPIPLTTNVNSYEIGTGKTVNTDKPLKVIQAWNRNVVSNVDVPMRILTKQEYSILGNKTTSGNPIQIYYEPLRDHGVLHLFPTPSSVDATAQQIYITYQRPILRAAIFISAASRPRTCRWSIGTPYSDAKITANPYSTAMYHSCGKSGVSVEILKSSYGR